MIDEPLDAPALHPDPLRQFERWFRAVQEIGVSQPEAMALATATPDGAPAVRMVLMKGYDERGFTFFTNYDGRKGRELAANPQAALLFHWERFGRQIRIEGRVEQVSREETAAYVRTRPRGSQLSALASPQSQVVENREVLEARVADLAARYGEGELPIPERWGGFRLLPHAYEFWQHRRDRLHDRFRYLPDGEGWRIERLAP